MGEETPRPNDHNEMQTLIRCIQLLDREDQKAEKVQLCFQGLQKYGDQDAFLEPLAEIFYAQSDLERVCDYLERLAQLDQGNSDRWSALGAVLVAAERNRDAVEALRQAVDLDPDNVASTVNLGITLVKLQWHQEAVELLRPFVLRHRNETTAFLWLGHALKALDLLEEAAKAYETVADSRDMSLHALMPLGLVYRDLGDLEQSTACFKRILEVQPEQPMTRFALAQNQLMLGDFTNGFENYEYRWKRPGNERQNFASPLWQGADINGAKILVHDEQGFGDCIQFSRFLSKLKKRGAEVAFKPRARLRKLLSCLEDVDQWVIGEEAVGEDYHLPLLSLPFLLGLKPEAIDGEPYLTPHQGLVESWNERLGKGEKTRVGLIWQGDPASQSEQGRSIPFEVIRPLFELADMDFYILQKHHGREELEQMELPDNVFDLADELDNGENAFIDTAAVMSQLDLVISSDTATAHLAGALGVPCWVLLKHVPEWRWGLQGAQSIWYKSCTLFRQEKRGNWQGLLETVSDCLGDVRATR